MSKRLVVCCDGTWDTPDQVTDEGLPCASNVTKVALEVAEHGDDGKEQLIFYHRGVGTSRWQHVAGGAFGYGLSQNVKAAYRFIVENFAPGDELFLFGFSRGAFTARSTAGLVRNAGILKSPFPDRVDQAYALYRKRQAAPRGIESQLFRRSYSHETRISFIGVWDTVGALGIPLSGLPLIDAFNRRYEFHDTNLSTTVDAAFQALAIDEKRGPFRPAIWQQQPNAGDQKLEQVWFAGVHCNVGGGYPNTALSDLALLWMVDKARSCGLTFRPDAFSLATAGTATDDTRAIRPDGLGLIRESRRGMYELIPPYDRPIGVTDPAHEYASESAVTRFKNHDGYAPANLGKFLDDGGRIAGRRLMSPVPVLLSVNVGMPKDVSWQGRTVHTGIWKEPVEGPVMARRLNLDGDGQGDTAGHGGEQRAVMVYQIDSYRHWTEHFGRDDLTYGQFGENLTIDGLADDEVCIGDRYRIGEAEFEVTQPRVTCYRVGMRLGEPQMPALLVSHHRPGFYMRVITEGRISAGDQIIKTRTGPHALTVAEIDALLYLPDRDLVKLRQAVDIPALSPGWQGSFRDLLAEADGLGAAGVPAVGTEPSRTPPAWPGFRPLLVDRVVRENATVSSIYLVTTDGTALPAATAGQYLTLRIPDAGEPVPVRSYSLSSAPDAKTYRISVKHEPHGVGSTYLTTALQPGTTLDVAAPRGMFVLHEGTDPIVLLSAGIGVTPVLAMLHELVTQRSERDVWWIHGARRPEEQPLAAEAHELLSSLPRSREHIFYSGAVLPAQVVEFHAETGRLTKEKLAALNIPVNAAAYLCGPQAFMTGMQQALVEIGIEPTRIFTELFGALPSINPGVTGQARRTPHVPPGPPGTGPLVTFARSGIATAFGDGQSSLLDLAEACDVPARWSCRTGVCHTCTTPLLSGDVSYSPDPLEPAAVGNVLLCCSRPVTDVVVDM